MMTRPQVSSRLPVKLLLDLEATCTRCYRIENRPRVPATSGKRQGAPYGVFPSVQTISL